MRHHYLVDKSAVIDEPTGPLTIEGIDEFAVEHGATLTHEDQGPFRTYRLEWENGDWAEIHRNGTWIHWHFLQTDGEGRYHEMMEAAPFFGERGFTHYSSNRGGADEALLKTGFELDPTGYLLYNIIRNRHAEYRAWKSGDGPKPAWRETE